MATKIPYRTAYGEQIRFFSPTGDGMEDEYGYEVNKKGQKELVKTGEKNRYLEIQSYKEDCLIENILARAAVGDMRDFRPQGIYADTTKLPKNMIEAKKAIVNLENMWAKLPNEIKQRYDNSVESFVAQAGSKAWMMDMGYMEQAPTVVNTAPETKTETPKETTKTE